VVSLGAQLALHLGGEILDEASLAFECDRLLTDGVWTELSGNGVEQQKMANANVA
jgi:hypothetical protein